MATRQRSRAGRSRARVRRNTKHLGLAAGMLCLCASGCWTLGPERDRVRPPASYACPLTSGAVAVDGALDEEAWKSAQLIRDFCVPATHATPRQGTEARIMWDRRHLYVAFRAEDEDLLGVHSERDADTYRDDVLEIFLKTGPDEETHYNFEVNPLGTLKDEMHTPAKRFQTDWNCEGVKVAARIAGTLNDWADRDEGWQLEVAIPFASLPSLGGTATEVGDVWRFHLARIERSVRSREGREPSSCAPLTEFNYHASKDWLPLEFAGSAQPGEKKQAPRTVQAAVHHSSDLGWTADQDVTEEFASLLKSGKLKAGEKLVLDHTYRISGSHQLPDSFTLCAAEGAGLDVTDATERRDNRPLLELGESNTLRNLTIRYLNTPPLGPTGEKHEKNFARRLGVYASGKSHLRIENCRLTGSIDHHLKLVDCSKPKVIGCHIAGGHWSVLLVGNVTAPVFRRCLIEKCQGDAIKTGLGGSKGVRVARVENCVFQDNLRDGIDTTGGWKDSVVRNCIFRRMGRTGMDIKAFYERKEHVSPDVGCNNILIENCRFYDMPNGIVVCTLDAGGRKGEEHHLLKAANIEAYATHDVDINDCVFGHAEKPLRSAREGGYGVNYPTAAGEHMRMIHMKGAHSIRYRNARSFGERIQVVAIQNVFEVYGAAALSKEASDKLHQSVWGTVGGAATPSRPGATATPFACGPRPLE